MQTINLKKVTRKYCDSNGEVFLALNNLSLSWNAGESLSVMGESGSGKSTLARLLIGLERPSSGIITINNEDTANWSFSKWRKKRKDIQAVFQDTSGSLNPGRSTYRNVEEALCNFTNQSFIQRKSQILSLMELTELSPTLLEVPVHKLSGGEQRRLALLRSLVIKPKFLVLDEVTAGLDLISTEAVLRILENYQKEYDCTYFIITHDAHIAKRLCKTIYEMKHGELLLENISS